MPPFPKLIFLDTNIVQNLHIFWEFILDNSLTPQLESKMASKGQRFVDDIHALRHFMALGQRYGWPMAVSPNTLTELEANSRANVRAALLSWGKSLEEHFVEHFDVTQGSAAESSYSNLRHFTFIQRGRICQMLEAMPHEGDRQLVIDALERGCDIFLTMDYRSIWSHREAATPLGVRIMTPVDILDYIGPWIGLLR